jgi:choline dehydrogenase
MNISCYLTKVYSRISYVAFSNLKNHAYSQKQYGHKLRLQESPGTISRSDWECAIHYFTYPLYHDACTCPMGPATDSMAVVTSRLMVHGVSGLRVVDALVMPDVVSGNSNLVMLNREK